jgi:hypothetical protein
VSLMCSFLIDTIPIAQESECYVMRCYPYGRNLHNVEGGVSDVWLPYRYYPLSSGNEGAAGYAHDSAVLTLTAMLKVML